MKKVVTIVLVFALSFGFLTLVNNMGSETVTASTPETLTGTAEGFGGDISVTVVVNGDDIVSVDVVGDDETEGIGTLAIDELPIIISEADSADVEGVSGATYTSDAIKEAVKKALDSK